MSASWRWTPLPRFTAFGPVQKKFQGWMQEGRIGGEKILLLKPATFMNESGRAGGRGAALSTSSAPMRLTVFHDELDLAPFKVKVKQGGGTAGHNGLRSIDQHLGPDFRRVRIGIGHPGHKDRVTGYVLGNYAKAKWTIWPICWARSPREADGWPSGDDARFMSEVALRE
jgi:PTH1 family peptidyl-tRNA hydrolase